MAGIPEAGRLALPEVLHSLRGDWDGLHEPEVPPDFTSFHFWTLPPGTSSLS